MLKFFKHKDDIKYKFRCIYKFNGNYNFLCICILKSFLLNFCNPGNLK